MYNSEGSIAKASLICSIISFFIFPFIFGIIGVVLGVIGISRQEENQVYSLLGIIIGIISVLYAFSVTGLI